MGLHGGLGSTGIPRHDRRRDHLMLTGDCLNPVPKAIGGLAEQDHQPGQSFQPLGEERVARRLQDRVMETPVMARQNSGLNPPADMVGFLLPQLLNDAPFGLMGMGGGQFRRHPLKHAAIGVEGANIPPVKPPHPEAIMITVDYAFSAQTGQRLPQRGPADIKRFDQLNLFQAAPGLQLAILYRRDQPLPDAAGCGLPGGIADTLIKTRPVNHGDPPDRGEVTDTCMIPA